MNIETTFNLKEFLCQVNLLRDLMGDKNFWKKDKLIRDKAKRGLIHVYLNLYVSESEWNMAANIIIQTLTDYTVRERLLTPND